MTIVTHTRLCVCVQMFTCLGVHILDRERDHVFIGNQREQLQKEPAHANLPLPSPLMFWGRCLSVDFEGIWGRC